MCRAPARSGLQRMLARVPAAGDEKENKERTPAFLQDRSFSAHSQEKFLRSLGGNAHRSDLPSLNGWHPILMTQLGICHHSTVVIRCRLNSRCAIALRLPAVVRFPSFQRFSAPYITRNSTQLHRLFRFISAAVEHESPMKHDVRALENSSRARTIPQVHGSISSPEDKSCSVKIVRATAMALI